MWVLAVANGKGGANKTTVAVNLAAVLAVKGWRVLLLDIDRQGSATFWSERIEKMGHQIPFDFASDTDPQVLKKLRLLEDKYDVIIVDTPGNLEEAGGKAVIGAVLDTADFALVPTVPDPLCFPPMRETINELIKPCGIPYRVLISNVHPLSTGENGSRGQAAALIKKMGLPMLDGFLRQYTAIAAAPGEGTLLTLEKPTRETANALYDLNQVAVELISLLLRELGDPAKQRTKEV